MIDQRKAYEEKFDAQLQEWSAKIALFDAKAGLAKAETKIEYYKTIDLLQGKQDAARTKFQELAAARDEAWEDIKIGAENLWAEVKDTFHSADSRFR